MHTVEIEQAQVGGGGPLRLIRRHPLISFFIIAFASTWTYDLLFLVFFPIPDIPGRSTPRDFGPSGAALVVTAVVSGKSGLRRFFQHVAFSVIALIIVVATRGRLGHTPADDRAGLGSHSTAAAVQPRGGGG
jgi:hypothetical protein